MQVCPNCGETNPERFRLCGFCGTPLGAVASRREVRKTVTILFSDLRGSTALGERLDPEALHEVKDRYFAAMEAQILRHGGKVEKYIGDAIMAVFGLPRAREDDALRAVRAAAGMQEALAAVNDHLGRSYGVTLASRTGVNTGEVLANVDPGADQKLATGDAVNVAARLEQAAPANEVLIGATTHALVRDAVEVEPVEPLELKGKAERVPAYRLLRVLERAEGRARREDGALVGRDDELARLGAAFAAAAIGGGCRLLTVVGDAGVGKSRLVREFTASVGNRAVVVRGRCLSYGEGITFWPFVEIVRGAAAIREDEPQDVARGKLLALVGERDVAARVAALAGLASTPFPLPELFWGARRFFEIVAANGPLVLVVDDIHWAEPAFLQLLGHLVTTIEAAPVMILATARHDLIEEHADWAAEAGSELLMLDPLAAADVARLVNGLLGEARLDREVRDRIVAAAEGNPLFVEQLVSMLQESGALRNCDGRWVRVDETAIAVPPTIQALLAARLDRLGADERAVVEPAAVIGLRFAEAAVVEMAPPPVRPGVPMHLESLTRKRLVLRDQVVEDPGPGYRFQHLLVRDAAYGGLLKRSRASLHEAFVRWADRVNADTDRALEFQEILGYHLEQAHRYLAELGPLDDHGVGLGVDGARRLAAAARRAFARGDMHAAANLFRRAAALLREHDTRRLALLPELGEALVELGEFAAAAAVLDDAERTADDLFEDRLAAHARLVRLSVDYYAGGGVDWGGRAERAAEAAIPVFTREADEAGLARAWRLRFAARATAGMYGAAADAAVQVVEHARMTGDGRQEARGASSYAQAALYGPTPVDAAIRRCEEVAARLSDDRRTEGLVLCSLAELRAMRGDFPAARAAYRAARQMLAELGPGVLAASTALNSARVEWLARDLVAAEGELRRDHAALEAMGERFLRSSVAARLAAILLDAGRADEAAVYAAQAEELAANDDIEGQALWRSVRARLHARAGEAPVALRRVAEAVDLLRPTESPVLLADALVDVGEVQAGVGDVVASDDALREALDLYLAKGHLTGAALVRRRLEGR